MSKPNTNRQTVCELAEFAGSIEESRTFSDLRSVCVGFFNDHGVVRMSYHHLPPLGAQDYDPHITVAAHGFPDDWVELYVSRELYRIDPIPRLALASTVPFRWSDTRSMPGISVRELEYLDLLATSGIGDGLAIPVFGPFARNGYVGLGFGADTIDLDKPQVLQLRLASQLGHQAYCEILHAQAPKNIRLSSREREILEWVSRGKSNAVIAQILSISSHTVDTHLRRVYQKMGVADRVTAALRGMALGLLS